MPINEILKFDVNWNGSNRASATTIINDTSRPEYEYSLVASTGSTNPITEINIPTYVLSANKSTMNEGESVIFSLTTTKLDPGTIIPFTITGITVADITADSLTGNFVIDDTGKASLTIVTIADYVTEVNMNMVVTLDNLGVSQSVILNDTSRSPTYVVGWYSDAGGITPINATNEGTTAYLVLKTTSVVNGTSFNVALSGTNITTSDVTSASLVGSITVTNNIGYLSLGFVNDMTTEGAETIRGTVSYNSTVVAYADLIINDTSFATVVTPDTTTQDNGWTVVRGFNLANEFNRIYGRYPNSNDRVVLDVPANWAFIGSYTVLPGITIDSNCNAAASITINNNGIIAGIGGEGGGSDKSPQNGIGHARGYLAQVGGTGIKNTSTISVVVNNYNLVSGGGGGHGADGVTNQADTIHGGTGGIPYGWSNRAGQIRFMPLFKDWDTYIYQQPANYGENGADGNIASKNWGDGALAGYVKEGLVTINNINSGIVKGR